MSEAVSRSPSAARAILKLVGIAVAGGLVAAVPALFGWEALAYLQSWLGVGAIDPTWNDGDAAISFTAAGLAVAALLLTALAAATLGRRSQLSCWWSALAVGLAVAISVAPEIILFR